MDLKNKKVTIIGLARSGIAAAELALRLNAIVKISDHSTDESRRALFDNWLHKDKVQVEFGCHSRPFIEDSDVIILSPGVRIDADPVIWAREKNIPFFGEIEFASSLCRQPIIAVTGSNGKTTVTTLISEVLKKAGKRICLCGNIGTPLSKYVLDLKKDDLVVMEVSSFQLESIIKFHPHVSVFLNFSQNHLDRHKGSNEYFEAKKRIFLNQTQEDYAVLNYSDSLIKDIANKIKARVSYFNEPGALNDKIRNPNYLAVMAVTKIFDIKEDIAQKVFNEFKGVEHRLEWVRSFGGVDFINDSKSTTAESGRWALKNISKPIVMICGGRDKNIDFSPLKDLVRKKVKKMLVIGEAAEKMIKTFEDIINVEECDNLNRAVIKAKESAVGEDCIVFSPMCASFDMFTDFEERGRVFKKIVNQL